MGSPIDPEHDCVRAPVHDPEGASPVTTTTGRFLDPGAHKPEIIFTIAPEAGVDTADNSITRATLAVVPLSSVDAVLTHTIELIPTCESFFSARPPSRPSSMGPSFVSRI